MCVIITVLLCGYWFFIKHMGVGVKHSIVELSCDELKKVLGGKEDITIKEAVYSTFGIIAAVAASRYVFDPIINYLERRWKTIGKEKNA